MSRGVHYKLRSKYGIDLILYYTNGSISKSFGGEFPAIRQEAKKSC